MVVDDSVVVRGLVARWLDEEPGIEVVASLRTGREAVDQLDRSTPDVVLLDIEMPELDGLAALPLLLAKDRDLVVIMASTLTRHNAEASFKAMSLGAADYISEAGIQSRRHDVGRIPARTDRKGPPSRLAPQATPGAPPGFACRARRASAPHGAPAKTLLPSAGAIRLRPFGNVRAAGAADRLLDRRAAGPERGGRRSSPASSTAPPC